MNRTHRGLRQAYPLSRFLSSILADSLNLLFERAKALGIVWGIQQWCFRFLSVLRFNFAKTVLCGVGIKQHEVEFLAKQVGCKHEELPLKSETSRLQTWQPIIYIPTQFHASR